MREQAVSLRVCIIMNSLLIFLYASLHVLIGDVKFWSCLVMNNTLLVDCKSCVVSRYSSSQDSFCHRCCNGGDAKQYCISLHDQQHGLVPFVALNDGIQAKIYAKRLELRGVSHILLRWNSEGGYFSEVDETVSAQAMAGAMRHSAVSLEPSYAG